MTVTREQLDSFHEFAAAQLANGGVELTFEQLLDMWRIQNPTAEQYAENVAAIEEAIRDMQAGERGEPVEDVLRKLRQELNLSSAE